MYDFYFYYYDAFCSFFFPRLHRRRCHPRRRVRHGREVPFFFTFLYFQLFCSCFRHNGNNNDLMCGICVCLDENMCTMFSCVFWDITERKKNIFFLTKVHIYVTHIPFHCSHFIPSLLYIVSVFSSFFFSRLAYILVVYDSIVKY